VAVRGLVVVITVLASVGLARSAHGDDVDGWLGAGFFLVLAVLAVVFQFGLRERMLGRALRRHPERAPLLERLQRQRGWWSLVAPIVMVWFAARAFEHDAPWTWCYLAAAVARATELVRKNRR